MKMNQQERILDISWGTILKISIAIIVFYILYQVRNILIWFIFALVISILFDPPINFLRKLKIPRVLATSFIYVGFFGILILSIYLSTPMFISEIHQFSKSLPQFFEIISPPLRGLGFQMFESIETFINSLNDILGKLSANILNVLFLFFGGVFTTIFILTVAIFLSLEEKAVERTLSLVFPEKYESYILSLWRRCQKKVSGWFLARLIACIFVGVALSLTLLLFHGHYPFSLGLIAGILNFIPVVGPLVTGIILFVIISIDSFLKAIFVIIAFTLIQLVENNLLTPILLKKIIDLPPVLVLVALAVGGVLWGFLGAILAVPIAGILFEFLKEFLQKRKEERKEVLS